MGCMGCLDAGCGVVCVVAGLDDGCCVGWEFVFRLVFNVKRGCNLIYSIDMEKC